MHMLKKRPLVAEERNEGLTVAEQFYALAARSSSDRGNWPSAPLEQNLPHDPWKCCFDLGMPASSPKCFMRVSSCRREIEVPRYERKRLGDWLFRSRRQALRAVTSSVRRG